MTRVVPTRFLFRYAVDVPHVASLPGGGRTQGPLDLGEDCLLPDVSSLDESPSFARLKVAWNDAGLGMSLLVEGRRQPPSCDARSPEASDGLLAWIDTRHTLTVHRATRFCHAFCFLPSGGGKRGDRPVAVARRIARARENAAPPRPGVLRAWSELAQDGYRLDAWIPAEALHGWQVDGGDDAGAATSLGFYWAVHDSELGEQVLSVPEEFPYAHDPSLWATLKLQPAR